MRAVLRDYQERAVDAVMAAIAAGRKRILFTAATGTGKSVILAAIVRGLLADTYLDPRILFLSHRREINDQCLEHFVRSCDVEEYEIAIEQAQSRAEAHCKIVVGSVQTVINPKRLERHGWTPSAILIDESHRAAARSYRAIMDRYPDAVKIGCTATPERTDKTALYAVGPDGQRTEVLDAKKNRVPCRDEDAVFEVMAFQYPILDAVTDGWLVPFRAFAPETGVDLTHLHSVGGDYSPGELEAAVNTDPRNNLIVSAWRDYADGRQTLCFCQGVAHAEEVARLFCAAGVPAVFLSGESDAYERSSAIAAFRSGHIKVICNDSLLTEGVDLPQCSCVLMARPTKSWNRYVQSIGRGLRPLAGLLDDIQDAPAETRQLAIAASAKPDCILIDLVDNHKAAGNPCTAPAVLHLPADLDLEGHSIVEAKKLLDKYEESSEQAIGEDPKTFTYLKHRLEEINLMRQSGARSVEQWRSNGKGYTYVGTPPGYEASLAPDGDGWRIQVKHQGAVLLEKSGKSDCSMKAYLDAARIHAVETIDLHRQASRPGGTLDLLSEKQKRCLRYNGHMPDEIDKMSVSKANKLISIYMEKWNAQKEHAA
jgi:superfamily II DNA or RNA helicase